MPVNASKTANSNINLELLHRHLKQQVTTHPHVRPKFKAKPNTRNGCHPDIFESFWFSEGAKVAFPIVIKSYKLIGNSYKTKFVCSLFVGVQYCQITKPCLCGKWQIWVTKVKKNVFYHPNKWGGGGGGGCGMSPPAPSLKKSEQTALPCFAS